MGAVFKLSHAMLLPAKRINSGVQTLLPEEGGRAARCHVQTIPSFSPQLVSPFAQNPLDFFFSSRTDVTLIKYQTVSTPGGCGINPVRFCAKTDGFWGILAPGDLKAQEKII